MSDKRPLRVLSLGAGVQSTTIALMAARGEIAPIDYAVFADTQSEPRAVYEHLSKLLAPGVLPFPVSVVTRGSLKQEILDASAGKRGAWGRPPLFIRNPDGSKGMTNRQCTQDYKLALIDREVRRLAGIKPRSRGPKHIAVEQVIGISLDEAHRQKDAKYRWQRLTYPLIDLGMNRIDCVKKLASFGWNAPKSACTFCPYHSDEMWQEMKQNDPVAWADAVSVDNALRSGKHIMLTGVPYLHETLKPLAEIDFPALIAKPRRKRQLRLYLPNGGFGNECAGVCGV
jgi:hypothetical protein